jgi:tetratricopeptide (TPR) repeat protein
LALRALELHDQADHSRKIQEQAKAAIKNKQILTSVLLYLADSLATGNQSGDQLREHRELFQNDANCKVLFSNLSGQDEAASKKLKSLEKAAGPAVHILRIFEAGVLSARGQHSGAQRLYLEALKTDPYIAGAWKDLGDMYFQAFECEPAWQCWDAARHLAPEFKGLGQVAELEQMLRKECPEFF